MTAVARITRLAYIHTLIILGHVCKFGARKFALKSKHLYRIDPTFCIGLAPGRTSEVGQGQSQEKFFMVGR